MAHIFISYSHKDINYVEKLEKKLISEGFDVWVDHRIDYGSRWTKEIENAIDTCDAYIVVMSETAKESQWVQREVIHAENQGKPFFPLLLKGKPWFTVANIQFVDVTDGSLPPEKYYRRLGAVVTRREKSSLEKEVVSQRKALFDGFPKISPSIFLGIAMIVALIFGIRPLMELFSTGSSPPGETKSPVILPKAESIETWTRVKDGMVMSQVPAGEFDMGGEGANEGPVHTVPMDSYWIDQTEVTYLMFAQCVDAGSCNTPSGENFSDWRYEEHPVQGVSWEDANSYCEWVGARLPTEAEWEKAARGIDGRTYPWGEGLDCTVANYHGCIDEETTMPVGSYENGRSPYGLYDMAGNVWEWVADWYSTTYYAERPVPNPQGPETGTLRVIRGGSSNWDAVYMPTYTREGENPLTNDDNIGFRCAMSEIP